MVRLVMQIVCTGVALRAVPRVLQSTAAEWGRSLIGRRSASGCNDWGMPS